MRVPPDQGLVEPHFAHHRQHARLAVFGGQVVVQFEWQRDLPAHREQRVERGAGILEHHADRRAAQGRQVAVLHADDLLAVHIDRSADRGFNGQQAHHRARDHRFA